MERGAAPTELGTERMGKLLRKFAVPGIIAQTAASLYNMVDSIYIGHIPGVGSYAISGLAVTFPLMNLSVAIGTLVGVGSLTVMSIMLGKKDYDSARKLLSNVLTLNLVIGLLFTALTIPFLDPILRFFGASDNTLPFARDYMLIILGGNVITHLYYGFNGIIRSMGHPKTAMGLTLFTVISNAILDPLFIFVFGLGIKGAAIATILCQVIAFIYTMKFLMDKRNFIHLERPFFRLDPEIVKPALSVGVGPFLLNTAACLVALFTNQQLFRYDGDLAIGAYGIVNRFTTLFVMICLGINQGFQPIAGYNYGAKLYSRVKRVFLIALSWEMVMTTLCCILSMLIPRSASMLFSNDPELVGLSVKAMRMLNCAFWIVGFGILSTNLFQCLGMVGKAIFLSLTRQVIILVPLLYLLPLKFGETGIWVSFPISDILSGIIAFFMVRALFKKFSLLGDGDDAASLGGVMK